MDSVKKRVLAFRLFCFVCLLVYAQPSPADLTVVREVLIAPKTGRAAGYVGAVNSFPKVGLDKASITISVGKPLLDERREPLPIVVRGFFLLTNDSDQSLLLTIGFPVSNSEYSSYRLEAFNVVSDGEVREVFRRKSGYPRRLVHEYVSGDFGPDAVSPPADMERGNMKLFGSQYMGGDTFQNLMVWQETFAPGQRRSVEVEYQLTVPLQEARVLRQRVSGNHKSTWPQEANNVPPDFVDSLPEGPYYFFDYYLTSGASWAGPIGFEEILMNFDQWWYEVEFYTTIDPDELLWSSWEFRQSDPVWMYYSFENSEPTKNVYFAIRHYTIQDEIAGRPHGDRKNRIREPIPELQDQIVPEEND